MLLQDLVKKYELSDETAAFMQQYGFEEAEKNFRWPLEELAPELLADRWQALQLPGTPEVAEKALAEAGKCEYFQHLFYYLYYYWYKLENALIYNHKLPDMHECLKLDQQVGLLELAMAIAGCPSIEKKFAELKLPGNYAQDAIMRISEDAKLYSRSMGYLAYSTSGHHWMRFFVNGELFRIGRFEYMTTPDAMPYAPYVYMHKKSRQVIALCRSDWRFDRDGWRLWLDYPDEEPYCVTEFQETADFVRGTPINPAGFAEVGKTVTLDKNEYELLWNDKDFIPDMHIPPGGGMTPELCEKSLKEAMEFFQRYFACKPKAFICFSWVFNPDLCEVLPESNLTKLMRNVYLTPFAGSSLSGLGFVFGKSDKDWSNYPAETSLQKAFHTLRKQGKRLKTGGMFIEAEGIRNFNKNYYSKTYRV
jgi:hypothetical protein